MDNKIERFLKILILSLSKDRGFSCADGPRPPEPVEGLDRLRVRA
jgi:hypothetical protein